MDRNPFVYIIIITYNGSKYIINLLNSIFQSSFNSFTVLLVDNDSKDNTIIDVKKNFPTCKIIENKSNIGFAGGCNIGLKKAIEDSAEFILILNQDCLVQKNTLSNLIVSAQNKPAAGVLGPKTWFFHSPKEGRPRILYAGAWRLVLPLVQRVPGIGKYDDGKYDQSVPVNYVWGHGMFLRASALQVVGLFDPEFFMYYEDLDLCRRMEKAGYEVWYEPSAVMWHGVPDAARGSESEGWRWENKCRSIHIFHRKYYGPVIARILDSLTLLSEIIRLLWSGYNTAAGDLTLAWIRTMRTN
jgi:GT2 family glycosyltransferase